jgi:hypothetical protein
MAERALLQLYMSNKKISKLSNKKGTGIPDLKK